MRINRKGLSMKRNLLLSILMGGLIAGSGLAGLAQSNVPPGTMTGLSADVNGMVSVTSVSPGGCATRICTTNIVSYVHCYTNCNWHLVCTTNASGVHCTNVLVCSPHCYTNTFPRVTCTNVILNPTFENVNETISGTIAENHACDELSGLFPSNAVFHAALVSKQRTNDWRGTHVGSFKIISGTNVLAYGSLSGLDGVGSHRGLEACSICDHLEGTLRGTVAATGPLHGASIKASYAGNQIGVSCPNTNAPQGSISLAIDGVVVTRCPSLSAGGDDDDD